ncbi:helicase associated domain-containing protein [Streptomyces sp. NPDC050485]|uniref:helicase associated domain-containing protein n=1 Tax=Streptomyces sp. NPDC050485 TaxID=3365617 RepID=UPI00379BCFA9
MPPSRRTSRLRGRTSRRPEPWPRPGGLGKDPKRAKQRAVELAAVDPDWNPAELGWTVDWQRHYVGLAVLLKDGALLTGIVPGVTWRGDDIGRWLLRQQRDFGRLNPEQQKRLSELGVKPAVRARTAAVPSGGKDWGGARRGGVHAGAGGACAVRRAGAAHRGAAPAQ